MVQVGKTLQKNIAVMDELIDFYNFVKMEWKSMIIRALACDNILLIYHVLIP